jgi:hypothetical protein
MNTSYRSLRSIIHTDPKIIIIINFNKKKIFLKKNNFYFQKKTF